MKLAVETIVLNGMPWLPCIFVELNRLIDVDWRWYVVEGAAQNRHCTRWCKPVRGGISTDGTKVFLDDLSTHPRVKVYRRPLWDGKIEMVRAPLADMTEPCVLLQADSDELWTADQLRALVTFFEANPDVGTAHFPCYYYIGANLIVSKEGSSKSKQNDWVRAWRYEPGMNWITHEPPNLAGNQGRHAPPEETESWGLKFSHYSYATFNSVRAKQVYYGYTNATQHWMKLRENANWPVRDLGNWLPWCDKNAEADVVFESTGELNERLVKKEAENVIRDRNDLPPAG